MSLMTWRMSTCDAVDGLIVTVYARVTGGGYRGAISVRRADCLAAMELACELPQIFVEAAAARGAAADFAEGARIAGTLLRMLEAWEDAQPRHPPTIP
jgi:hypothetical protein